MNRFQLASLEIDDVEPGGYVLGDGDEMLIVYYDEYDGQWWVSHYVKADEGDADVYKNFSK